MSETESPSGKRDRSPSSPYIGLEKAVERTRMLYAKAKRFDVRIADAAADWALGPKSSATLQTVGALLAFGLIEDSGSGDARKIKVSDTGWRILDDNRPGVREKLLAEAALKPKLIAELHGIWQGDSRPDDAHAISQLKFDYGFTDDAAAKFLRVYDETVRFTKPIETDTVNDTNAGDQPDAGSSPADNAPALKVAERAAGQGVQRTEKKGIVLMDGERELTTGLLSKGASFRLIVSGPIGEKEIERLIKKLELDKEILADDLSTEIEETIASGKGGGGVFE